MLFLLFFYRAGLFGTGDRLLVVCFGLLYTDLALILEND